MRTMTMSHRKHLGKRVPRHPYRGRRYADGKAVLPVGRPPIPCPFIAVRTHRKTNPSNIRAERARRCEARTKPGVHRAYKCNPSRQGRSCTSTFVFRAIPRTRKKTRKITRKKRSPTFNGLAPIIKLPKLFG